MSAPPPPMRHSAEGALRYRACSALLTAAVIFVVGGCSAVPVPPVTWLRLPVELAATTSAVVASSSAGAGAGGGEVWQLMLPMPLPGHLERDGVFVPQSATGAWVRPLAGARWVEPLRDAVPRLLREDLLRQLGGQALWTTPLPPGLSPTRQLRIEITALDIGIDGRALVTHARWSLADARGARGPSVHEVRFETQPGSTTEPEAWAQAHRQAIATLAARIAATMSAP